MSKSKFYSEQQQKCRQTVRPFNILVRTITTTSREAGQRGTSVATRTLVWTWCERISRCFGKPGVARSNKRRGKYHNGQRLSNAQCASTIALKRTATQYAWMSSHMYKICACRWHDIQFLKHVSSVWRRAGRGVRGREAPFCAVLCSDWTCRWIDPVWRTFSRKMLCTAANKGHQLGVYSLGNLEMSWVQSLCRVKYYFAHTYVYLKRKKYENTEF